MNLIYGVIGTYALSNCSGSSLAKKLFFRKPTRPSLPLRKAPPLISVFSPQGRRGKPPYSVLRTATLKGWRGIKALARYCAGWDRLGIGVYSLQLIVYSLRLISWLFADNLQISCDSLGGFEEKA